jgi:PAS domain S-box-containing protein
VRLPAREYTWSAETFRILGLDPAAVTPSRQALLDRVHPDDRERLALALDAAVQDGHGVAFDSRIVRPDGTARVVHHQARAMRDGQGRLTGYHGTIQDISERKEVEQALRRATAELEHAQRIGKMGSWTWNVGDDSSQWSPALLEIYGRDPKGPAPTYAEMEGLLTPDSWARMQAAIGEAVTHGTPYTIELEVVRPDGAHRWVAGQAEVECDAQGRPARLVGTAQDFTERKLAELELRKTRDEVRELSRRFEEERDQERKRIAMDVHDEIGQLLTAMKHEIHLLRSHAGTAVASERGLQRLGELVDNSIEVTRNVAMTLRPPALDLGLTAALEWLAEDFELRSEIGCEVRVSGDDFVLDDRQAIALFRIAQESLTNVARHARARRVQIALDSAAGRLAMTINDDGRGFALASARQQGHFGLLGMQERAWRINATLSIDSRPGEGTSIHAELPICRGGTR